MGELGNGAEVGHDEFFAEGDVGIGLHEQLEEVQFGGRGILVDLNDAFVVLEVDGGKEVAVGILRAERGDDEAFGPCCHSLDSDALVALAVDFGLAGVLGLALCQLVIVLVEVLDAHDDTQRGVGAHGLGDCGADCLELLEYCVGLGHVDTFVVGCFGRLGEDAVHELVVAPVFDIFAVDVVVAEFELHLLGQRVEKRVLCFRRELGEHEVAFGLPFAPDLLKSTGVEQGEGHEVVGLESLLRPVEVALAVLDNGVLLALLEHTTYLQTRDADFLLHAGDDVDQSFLHKLVARGGYGEDSLEYLAVVIGVVYFDCHVCMGLWCYF